MADSYPMKRLTSNDQNVKSCKAPAKMHSGPDSAERLEHLMFLSDCHLPFTPHIIGLFESPLSTASWSASRVAGKIFRSSNLKDFLNSTSQEVH